MKKRKVLPLSIMAVLVIVVLSFFFLSKTNFPQFSGYDNNAVLGAPTLPKTYYNEKSFVVGAKGSSSLLTAQSIKLSGIEDILDTNLKSGMDASLKCTYSSLHGSFKLVLVSNDKNVVTLFDSDKQKSGETVKVPFSIGHNLIRLAGKPTQLENLSLTWVSTDNSKL